MMLSMNMADQAYEMPLTADKPWNTEAIDGSKRFLDRVWRMYYMPLEDAVEALEYSYHFTVKKVTEDYESLSFNRQSVNS